MRPPRPRRRSPKIAATSGAAVLLCAPTPYVKPSQEGIIAHMRMLAHVSDLPLILYDVPGRVGVAIKDETVATLFERGLAVGIKDATADLGRPPRLRALCGPELVQLTGDDATAAAYCAAGGNGCISVTANPRHPFVLRSTFLGLRRFGFIYAHPGRVAPLHDALFIESNPVPLKAALAILNLARCEVCDCLLVRAAETTKGRLADVLAQVMSLEKPPSRNHAMRWRADITKVLMHLVWACLVMAVAAYGAVVVRNVTDMLVAIACHQPSMIVAERPSR